MYLRRKQSLTIGEICQQWGTEPGAGPDPLNILTLLLQGFWRGALRDLHRPGGGKIFSRQQGLKALVDLDSSDRHPDIVICRGREQSDAEQILLANGDIVVDLRKYVFLPTDIADWTEELCGQAYEKLAECDATAYASEFLTGFKTMQVGKSNFLKFLRFYELEPPWFWYDPDRPSRGLVTQATTPPISSTRPRKGRPAMYDYASIDEILEALLLKDGLPALQDFHCVKDRLTTQLGEHEVPSDSQLRRHLKIWRRDRIAGA